MADVLPPSRNAPNPLRPYYIPPSIGPPPDIPQPQAQTAAPLPAYSSSRTPPKPSLGSQARDILSDIDYDSYFPDATPTVAEHAKKLLDQALWNYTSVLLAQPFEVAKTILQVHEARGEVPGQRAGSEEWGARSRPQSMASGKFEDYPSEEESDEDSPGYFTSTAPPVGPAYSPGVTRSGSPEKRRRQGLTPNQRSRSRSSTPIRPLHPPSSSRKLDLKKPDALLEVIAQLWQKESAWGVWKGTNATFIYNFLLKTTESWFRSLISALLNVPDPGLIGTAASGIGGLDIVDSPSPLVSLGVAVTATAIAATLLAPLDLIRTRLVIAPITSQPRSIYPCLALLPSFTIPTDLIPATLLHACIPTLISSATPLFLRSSFAIDPLLTPTAYSLSTFLSSTAELFARLPLETVLRRGQVAVLHDQESQRYVPPAQTPTYLSQSQPPTPSSLRSPAYDITGEDQNAPSNTKAKAFDTVVDPGPWKGVFGTMWFIVRDEGVTLEGPSAAKAASAKAAGFSRPMRTRKGQGVHGLWRGWRVGVWGLVGIWGAAAMGGGGGEF
ncbi:mitochondrial carrier [Dothidotthia symphoricarpi CBS 119687]|uniref:Mitochondrial carrier n=1 Tax=Dothidotthia symphoricarpi CBS 119687 TaxID=1392245 RepID=A0A6A6A4R2_9PLEO|nr:mitochondrial carrier [Dothidotthia symphoricarpi CBS 119687]KAF2125581.1 mitochondrial carrier [Dothidotthia symphoricarpi CBS 119687]